MRAPDSRWHGKLVLIAYRKTITSPKRKFPGPRSLGGRTVAGLVRQRWPAQKPSKKLLQTPTLIGSVPDLEIKGIHTAMVQVVQGLEFSKGVGQDPSVFRDQKRRGRFMPFLDRNNAPAPLPGNSLGRDSDELEIRHLSHPQASNFVVLSIPLKVVLGIAHRKRCTARTVTLGRDSDKLEIRHLSHPQARNFVVLSIPLKVVLGIAHRKRCTAATSHRQMAVSVSRPTMEHINIVLRKPASTRLWSERPKEI